MEVNYIYDYFSKIKSGEITVGKWILAIYEIIISGIEKGNYIFNASKADNAVYFIENYCRHSEGSNDLLTLELWQKAMVSTIFGIVDDNGYRIFREVFIVIARKNGKTLLASAIIAYMAFADGEYGAKIYCLAPKLDLADKVYDGFWQMAKNDKKLSKFVRKRRSDIYINKSNSAIKALAFNYKKGDGYNPSLVINDEVSSWPSVSGLRQYEVMASALGARKQPIVLSITTSGSENDGIYDELIARSTSFLKGNSKEKRLLPFLYIIDDTEKWNDISELKKSNPNMGVSVFEDFYEDQIAIAETSLPKKPEFLMKYCNIKQNSSVAWLDYVLVDKATIDNVTLEDFRNTYAVGGVDLSQSIDLTAATVLIERDAKLYSFTQFFMPKNRLETAQATDGVPYEIYLKKGILTLSGENYVDYNDVFKWFCMLKDDYEIYLLKIGYDKYQASYLVEQLNDSGYHTDDVKQGYNLTPVITEFEGILKDGNFLIVNNNLLKAHFLNVALKHNIETRKFMPVKIEQRARIDGFVSNINAVTVRQKYWDEVGTYLKND